MTDIPAAYTVAKTAKITAEMPHLAKYPAVLQQFIAEVLAAEWGAQPQTTEILLEMDEILAEFRFSMVKGSPVHVKLTLQELHDLHGQIGRLLGM